MRRIATAVLAVFLLVCLILPVSAATGASSAGYHTTVSVDGSCQVTLTLTLHLEQAVSELTFPLPRKAGNVTLNGSWVRTKTTTNARIVDLSHQFGNLTGDFTVTLQYTLSNVVTKQADGAMQLELPILAGFSYPIEALSFSITLPGEISEVPTFSSGYHGINIEKDLSYSVSGATISGASTASLKDLETLTLYLPVDQALFPQAQRLSLNFDFPFVAISVCVLLALVYWLVFLRTPMARRVRWSSPPAGYSAGQLSSVLTLQGPDLTMLIFSWAQLGYLRIQTDGQSRVLLHKRMDMGNERNNLEQRCFRELFAKQDVVDCSGARYLRLCQRLSGLSGGIAHLLHPYSGNPRIFRCLAALIGLFVGGSMGAILSSEAALQWLVVAVSSLAGVAGSYCIQAWAVQLRGRGHDKLLRCGLCCAGWLLAGILTDQLLWSILLIAAELLAGLMAFYGGRRTEEGCQLIGQLLGLRHYLRTVPKDTLRQLCEQSPEYFFDLIPYAMALGVDRSFARRFGTRQLPACPYLVTKNNSDRDAGQWLLLLRKTAAVMDNALRQSRMDSLRKLLHSLTGK